MIDDFLVFTPESSGLSKGKIDFHMAKSRQRNFLVFFFLAALGDGKVKFLKGGSELAV